MNSLLQTNTGRRWPWTNFFRSKQSAVFLDIDAINRGILGRQRSHLSLARQPTGMFAWLRRLLGI